MSVDSVGNFLTALRNAVMRADYSLRVPFTILRNNIAAILLREGFLKKVSIEGEGVKKQLVIELRYYNNESVIHEINQVSTPGRRRYVSVNEIPIVHGFGIAVMTTSHGVVSGKEAVAKKIGGELICTVW